MTTTTDIHPDADKPWRAPLFIPLLALWLFFLRFGYGYGNSDQGELLPAILHRLNPNLYAADWFVQTQAELFNVRFFVISLVEALAYIMPLWLAAALLYVACWLATAYAVYAIAYQCTGRSLAAALAVGAGLVLTPHASLGGNALVSWMFTPSMAGWALALWGVYFFLRGRYVWTALFLGLATWMQTLVGLQMAGLLGLLLLFEKRRQATAHFAAAYLLSAAPLLGPLIYQQLTSLAGGSGTPSLFYIMAEFRNPHHYLFFSFPAESYVQFGLVVMVGIVSYVYLRMHMSSRLSAASGGISDVGASSTSSLRGDAQNDRAKEKRQGLSFFWKSWAAIAVLCTIGFFFSEIEPILFITKLQLFKYTVFAKLLFVIVICGAIFRLAPASMNDWMLRVYRARKAWLGVMILIWTLSGIAIAGGKLGIKAKIYPLVHRQSPVASVENWAQTETPIDAVFAVPPSWSGFRMRAQRAVVVDFKSFPFQPNYIHTWYERLMDLAPLQEPPEPQPERSESPPSTSLIEGGGAVLDDLDRAFLAQQSDTWKRWQAHYSVDYVVTKQEASPYEAVFSSPPWIVYRLPAK